MHEILRFRRLFALIDIFFVIIFFSEKQILFGILKKEKKKNIYAKTNRNKKE